MALRVIGDKVLVTQITPDDAETELRKGKVVCIGCGRTLDSGARSSVDIRVGEFVWYSKHDAVEIPYENTEYLLLWEDDILIASDT